MPDRRAHAGTHYQDAESAALIEREAELAVLRKALQKAGRGAGSVVSVESVAGTGRSRLLAAAAELAADSGGRVLWATGRDTERLFPFGVALQLFEEHWLAATDDERDDLLRGPAEPVRRLISGRPTTANDGAHGGAFEIIHGLFWSARHMTAPGVMRGARAPLALIVDDVHRADGPSLQFLAYLGVRIQALPIVLVVSTRKGEPATDLDAWHALTTGASATLRPARLTREGAATVARAALPDADPAFWKACVEASAGNPLLIQAVLEDVRRVPLELTASAARRVHTLVPDEAVGMVRSQLRSLSTAAASVAAAVAVIAMPTSLAGAAAAAGLGLDEAAHAADALGDAGLLRPGMPLVFANDLIARAVLASISELERALLQQRAEGVSESPIAGQSIAPSGRATAPSAPVVPPVREEQVRLADLAVETGLRGEHRSRVAKLGELAWNEAAAPSSAPIDARVAVAVAEALLLVDELELGLEILADRDKLESDPDSTAAVATSRCSMLYHRGEVAAALRLAENALQTAAGNAPEYRLQGIQAACLMQLGQLDSAESALPVLDSGEPLGERDLTVLLELRAQLRLARNRPRDALADALEAGRRVSAAPSPSPPGLAMWRSTAALAHVALDEPGRAQELAEEELDLSRTGGVTRAVLRALRVLGLASTGPARLDALEQAVALGADAPIRLEYIHALVDLGAALRRANRRAAARQPLTKALELAHELGATAVAHRAQAEIKASEARRPHPRATGMQALTPGERRVALLAAQGRTTREIASELYITPKTVEFHLRHVYRKLGLPSTRADLTAAFRREDAAEPQPL